LERRPAEDFLIVSTIILVGLGILMVFSASSIASQENFKDGYLFVRKQVILAVVGFAAMCLAAKFRYQHYRWLSPVLLAATLIALALVFVPGIGHTAGNSTRWLKVGPVTVQPSEFAKLALVLFLSYSLARRQGNIQSLSAGFAPHLAITLPFFILTYKQPDFGTAVMFVVITCSMCFVAGVRLVHLASILAGVTPICFVLLKQAGYRWDRIIAFLDPWQHQTTRGFQIVQSFLALGSGGLAGVGLGNGRQKLFFLPEPHTDFIVSVIGEELGFLGVLFILGLFITIVYCGTRVALQCKDLAGCYLAFGITFLIGLQSAINVGVALGLLPPKGTPLPFVSYGGSSLVTSLFAVGVLINVASQNSGRRRR
jgi:cell division protein FtsW